MPRHAEATSSILRCSAKIQTDPHPTRPYHAMLVGHPCLQARRDHYNPEVRPELQLKDGLCECKAAGFPQSLRLGPSCRRVEDETARLLQAFDRMHKLVSLTGHGSCRLGVTLRSRQVCKRTG